MRENKDDDKGRKQVGKSYGQTCARVRVFVGKETLHVEILNTTVYTSERHKYNSMYTQLHKVHIYVF